MILMIIRKKFELDPNLEFIKVVIDIEKEILSAICELHVDCYEELVETGSEAKNLWGANLFPNEKRIDFISMINIRPKDKNFDMEIKIPEIKNRVESIIKKLLF